MTTVAGSSRSRSTPSTDSSADAGTANTTTSQDATSVSDPGCTRSATASLTFDGSASVTETRTSQRCQHAAKNLPKCP